MLKTVFFVAVLLATTILLGSFGFGSAKLRGLTADSELPFFVSSDDYHRVEPAHNLSVVHPTPVHTHKVRRRGLVEQPHDDTVQLTFTSHGKHFSIALAINAQQYMEDTQVIVVTDEGTEIRSPHRLASYSGKDPEKGLLASLTLFHDGTYHAVVISDDGEVYELDPLDRHKEHLDETVYRSLKQASPHEHAVFRRSDMARSLKRNTRCGTTGSGPHQDHVHDLHDHHNHDHSRLLADSSDNGDPSRWTDCFAQDSVARRLSVGFASDKGFYDWSGGSIAKVQDKIAAIVADTNTVYGYQMNIVISVAEFLVMQTSSTASGRNWNDAGGSSCMTIETKLNRFRTWSGTLSDSGSPRNRGLWHLMSSCYGCGTVGLAYIGTICATGSGYNTGVSGQGRCADWVTVAHEIGHNFNAQHSFEEGQGATGGIMDYGDGLLNGIYQFNTRYRKTEVCGHIASRIGCEHFSTYAPECGNGIIEAGEACECESGTNCRCCSNCQLTAGSECASGECCTASCKLATASQTCDGGQGHCISGSCQKPLCNERYGLEFCGTHTGNDCKTKCVFGGQCSDLSGVVDQSSGAPINLVPNGARCGTASGSAGQCSSGTCVPISGGTPVAPPTSPTKDPTKKPTSSPTRAPTRNPTKYPTNFPTRKPTPPPTRFPTNPPVANPTKKPTKLPTNLPTRLPTPRPTQTPTNYPTKYPTKQPTLSPTKAPTRKPTLPGVTNSPTLPVSYEWVVGSFGSCSVTCGNGVRTRSVTCKIVGSGVPVNDNKCVSSSKPESTTQCSLPACVVYTWKTEGEASYTACSKSCGGGEKTRVGSACKATVGGQTTSVSDSLCSKNAKNSEPPKKVKCNEEACPLVWKTGPYSSCTTTCGGGTQVRDVYCAKAETVGGTLKRVDDALCDGLQGGKPQAERECGTKACKTFKWKTSNFGPCSQICGPGLRTRSVKCVKESNGKTVSESKCEAADRPPADQECSNGNCPDTVKHGWVPRDWETCNVACGDGIQYREVLCHVNQDPNGPVVDEEFCTLSKPRTSQSCKKDTCPEYAFVASRWSRCSESCGAGRKTRTVECKDLSTDKVYSNSKCIDQGLEAPETTRDCNLGSCRVSCLDPTDGNCGTYWATTMWSSCSRKCGFGEKTRTVSCRKVSDNSGVPLRYCAGAKPSDVADCNAFACPSYREGEWGECSAICDDGVKNRTVTCVDHLGQEVSEAECKMERPATQTACNDRPCAHWHRSLWGECSKTCGGGEQTRELSCRLPHDNIYLGVKVEKGDINVLCPKEQPITKQQCNVQPCDEFYWERDAEWSSCTASCSDPEGSKGLQTRNVWCAEAASGAKVLSSNCEDILRPDTDKQCTNEGCPLYEWGAEKWGPCEATCGASVQRRVVECRDTRGDVVFGYNIPFEIVENKYCEGLGLVKPPETRKCNTERPGNEMCGSGKCGSDGQCICAPGYSSSNCTTHPWINNVRAIADETLFPGGVPNNDIVEVRWDFGGDIPYVDILLLEPGAPLDAASASYPWILTSTYRYPNEGVYLVEIPSQALEGDGYRVAVHFNDTVLGFSNEFSVADPCAYLSCGEHGVCQNATCACTSGYTGPNCAISPCVAADCIVSNVFGSGRHVERCDAEVDPITNDASVNCTCQEGWTGDGCKVQETCKDHCLNGGIAETAIQILGPGGNTEPTCGKCVCPAGTSFSGERCETCQLQCEHGSTPNEECNACKCGKGWFGRYCECRYYELSTRLNLRYLRPKLRRTFQHDVLKSIHASAQNFRGSLDNFVIRQLSADVVEISWHMKEECAGVSMRRRAYEVSYAYSPEEVSLKDAYLTLWENSLDEWSVLRSQGIASKHFDPEFGLKAYDPTGIDDLPSSQPNGLSTGVIVGIVLGSLVVVGLIGFGAYYVKENYDMDFSKYSNRRKSKRLPEQAMVNIGAPSMKSPVTFEYKNPSPSGRPGMGKIGQQTSQTMRLDQVSKSNYYKPPGVNYNRPPPIRENRLPPNWEAVKDEASGDIYYWNSRTDETSWTKPVDHSFNTHHTGL